MIQHLLIGKKDGDLAYWTENLPKGTISHYIRLVVKADIKKSFILLPVPQEQGIINKQFDFQIRITERDIEEHITSIPKNARNAYIRRILRKQLDWNYRQKKNLSKPDATVLQKVSTVDGSK